MKKRYCLHVQGENHRWSLDLIADPRHVEDWRNDGLDVYESRGSVPAWVPAWLVGAWCFLQDLFYWRSPL